MRDEEAFWLDLVRRSGSNMAVDGYAQIEDIIHSNRLDEASLRRLSVALRSLHQQALERANDLQARRKRPWEFQ